MQDLLTRAACLAAGLVVCAALVRAAAFALLFTTAASAQATPPADSTTASNVASNVGGGVWPHDIPTTDGAIRMFEPQVESLAGDTLTSRAAIAVTRAGGGAVPVFGAVRLTAKITTDEASHAVKLGAVAITRVLLPDLTESDEQRIHRSLENAFTTWSPTLSTERLSAAVADAEQSHAGSEAISTHPPRILVSKVPAVLMLIDGKPERRSLPGSDLEQVVNTPFAVMYQPGSKRYFTSNGNAWYVAPEATGPWTPTAEAPDEVATAVGEARRKADAARRAVSGSTEPAPGDSADSAGESTGSPSSATPPAIVVSTEPAEMLVFDGEPSWAPLTGTDLLVAMNTPSDVFMDIGSQRTFVLLAGRWFSAASLAGPWGFVPADRLPADFAKISPQDAKADVRASVAGTPEAQDAVLQAQIPQATAIDRHTAKLEVSYDGAPRFEPITGTEVAYAVNTSTQVLEIHDRFYAVDQGVWFTAPGPEGPWEVADQRPAEVDSIPPSSPVYNTRYVYVYDSTPDYVSVGYSPGYVGSYVWGPTVVYGTGYLYRPWYGTSFYARPYTWGFGVHYTPWWGYTWLDEPCNDFLWLGWGWGSSHHHHHDHHGHDGGYHPGWYGPAGPRPTYRPPPVYRPPPQPGLVPAPHVSSIRRAPRPPQVPHSLYVAPQNLPRVSPVATKSHAPRPYAAPPTQPTRPSYPPSMRPSPTPRKGAIPNATPPSSVPGTVPRPSVTPAPTHAPGVYQPRPVTPATPPTATKIPDGNGRTPTDPRPSYSPEPQPRGGTSSPGVPGSTQPDPARPQPWSPSLDHRERRAPLDPSGSRPSAAWMPTARPSAGWSVPEPRDGRPIAARDVVRPTPRYQRQVETPVTPRYPERSAAAEPRDVPRHRDTPRYDPRPAPQVVQREVAQPPPEVRVPFAERPNARPSYTQRPVYQQREQPRIVERVAPEPIERPAPRGYPAMQQDRPEVGAYPSRPPGGFMPSSRPSQSYVPSTVDRGQPRRR